MNNKKDKLGVLFVCLGNICRSPAAESVFRAIVEQNNASERYDIDSAGTYSGHRGQLADPRMRSHAALRGYTLTHRARPIQALDFDRFDLIITMDDANYFDVRQMAPTIEAEQRVHRMREFIHSGHIDYVPDPYYEGADGFELVLDLLEDSCTTLFSYTEKLLSERQ